MTNQDRLALLREIVGDISIQPAPNKFLDSADTHKWLHAPGFQFALMKANGERVGVRRKGVASARKFASSLANTHGSYGRGARPITLAKAVLDITLQRFPSRTPASITTSDLNTLEQQVSQWFADNAYARTCYIPCLILPDRATSFAVGPVCFSHVSDFTQKNVTSSPIDQMAYDEFFQVMAERRATWVAEITIDGCEKDRALEMADIAVDLALVGVQSVIPDTYSRRMSRLTGRTTPASIVRVFKSTSDTCADITSQDPGFALSHSAFEHYLSTQANVLESVGRRVRAYVSGNTPIQGLNQAWCDGAYWFHEGLAEPVDSVAIAKTETALEVLFGAESTKGSEARLRDAIRAFYGWRADHPLATDSSITVKQYVQSIVGARSRILHGTQSTLKENVAQQRADVEVLCFGLLRLATLGLDRYAAQTNPSDDAATFLHWIDAERQRS